jgi:hypothetical protein
MTDGARRVAAGFAATGGVARGADLIEQRVLRSAQLQFISHWEHATKIGTLPIRSLRFAPNHCVIRESEHMAPGTILESC